MYAYIKGELAEINTDHIIIEAGGIGYQVIISLRSKRMIYALPFYPEMPRRFQKHRVWVERLRSV